MEFCLMDLDVYCVSLVCVFPYHGDPVCDCSGFIQCPGRPMGQSRYPADVPVAFGETRKRTSKVYMEQDNPQGTTDSPTEQLPPSPLPDKKYSSQHQQRRELTV
eukprot:scpid100385/ scgid5276/ 